MSNEFISIDASGFDDLALQFGALSEQLPALTFKAANRVAREAVDFLNVYPARYSGHGRGFASDRQRRWFFAALRAGQITVPYQRTGILGRGWRTEASSKDRLTIVNNTDYTKWVQVKDTQASIHKGRWRTVEDAIEQMPKWMDESADKLGDEIISAFNVQR